MNTGMRRAEMARRIEASTAGLSDEDRADRERQLAEHMPGIWQAHLDCLKAAGFLSWGRFSGEADHHRAEEARRVFRERCARAADVIRIEMPWGPDLMIYETEFRDPDRIQVSPRVVAGSWDEAKIAAAKLGAIPTGAILDHMVEIKGNVSNQDRPHAGDVAFTTLNGDTIDVHGFITEPGGRIVGRVHFDGANEAACWCGPVVRTEQQDDGTFVETITHKVGPTPER